MADHGAEWYKRDPHAHLGGVVGMTSRQHAVYSVILDLIYAHGGRCLNEPKWFAGWFSDLGSAAIRNTISELVALGKLQVEGNSLTNKRARNEAKTRGELRESRREAGKKGGISSGLLRVDLKENNDLAQANASPREKKRKDYENIKGSGSNGPLTSGARACGDDDTPFQPDDPVGELLGDVIEAVGIDLNRDRNPQRWFGSESTHTVEQWARLDLTDAEIIETIAEVIAGKRDGPPAKLSYFNQAMQRRAGLKLRPGLTPIEGGKSNDGKSARERRAEEDLETNLAFARSLDRAAGRGL